MERLPTDLLPSVLSFLEVPEARQLAKTCKTMRNEIEKQKFHIHYCDLYSVDHPEWRPSGEYEDYWVMTKPEALKKAKELKAQPKAHEVFVWQMTFEPIGWESCTCITVFHWKREF